MKVRKRLKKTAGKIPSSDPDKTRLRAAVKRINIKNLIKHLEWLGADATNILRSNDERRQQMQSRMEIPSDMVDVIVAIPRLMPQRGRPDLWSDEIKETAMMGLLTNKPIWSLAKQIALATGQPVESVRSRLQKMNASQVKEIRENSRKHRVIARLGEFSTAELETMLRDAKATAKPPREGGH